MISKQQQIEWDNRAYDDYLERVGVEKGIKLGLEQGLHQGREEGREEGLEEGREEERIAIVKKLLQKGFDIKTVSQSLDLSEDKILELKASMKNSD